MPKISKIDQVREGFYRLGCLPDTLEDPFSVCWGRNGILFMGKAHSRTIDFEILMEFLKTLPDEMGQKSFWAEVEKTDFSKLYEEWNTRIMAALEVELEQNGKQLTRSKLMKRHEHEKMAG